MGTNGPRPPRSLDIIRTMRATAATGTIAGSVVYQAVRCPICHKHLSEFMAAPFSLRCPRCKTVVRRD